MNKPLKPDNFYLDVSQVAERYGVSTDTIWRWSRQGDLPKPVKIGPNVTRWRLADLIDHERSFTTCFVVAGWPLNVAALTR